MFCDVTCSVPSRDIHGKLGQRSCDGCHLGYDERRHGHFCYITDLQRLSTFTVTAWFEDSFEHVKRLTADTPVEYTEALDFPVGAITQNMLPRRYTARRTHTGGVAGEQVLHVLVLYHKDRSDSLVSGLRQWGHTVTTHDISDGHAHDLAQPS